MPWRSKGQTISILLSGNFHGQRSPAGYSTQGRKRVGHNSVTEQQVNILYFDFMMLVTEVHISVKTHQIVNLDGVMFYYIKLNTQQS